MATDQAAVPRLAALQHRDFRLFWLEIPFRGVGQLFSSTGAQMQQIAVDWHIYQLLRGSSYTLALFGREIGLDAKALGLVRILPVWARLGRFDYHIVYPSPAKVWYSSTTFSPRITAVVAQARTVVTRLLANSPMILRLFVNNTSP